MSAFTSELGGIMGPTWACTGSIWENGYFVRLHVGMLTRKYVA